MAKVYSPPAEVHVPDFDEAFVNGRYSMQKDDEVIEKFFDELRTALKANGYNSDLTGEVIYFPVADGQAAYMVAKLRPATLIHLPIHDAYQIPEAHERGLTAKDIREQVESQRALNALFGRTP